MYSINRLFRRAHKITPDIDSIRASERELKAALAIAQALQAAAPEPKRAVRITAAEKQLAQIGKRVRPAYTALLTSKTARTEDYRRFQFDHGLDRPAKTPNRMTTAFVAQIAVLIEGAGTAALAISDGKMDVVTGAVYGLTVAGLNVGGAMACGYFTGRYLDYGLRAPEPDRLHTRIRRTAWFGFFAFTGLLGLLNFAAARTRATGSPEYIFNLETLGLWATFGNYYAIALLVLGGLGALLGIYKGWSGISDPYPGFGEMRAAAEEAVDAEAEALRARLLDEAARVFYPADDALAEAIAEADDAAAERDALLDDLRRGIPEHNHAIDAAVDARKAQCACDQKRLRRIKQKPQNGLKPDTAPLNALRIDPALIPATPEITDQTAALRDAQARLQAAFDAGVATIEDAHSDFLISTPAYGLDD